MIQEQELIDKKIEEYRVKLFPRIKEIACESSRPEWREIKSLQFVKGWTLCKLAELELRIEALELQKKDKNCPF